MQITSLMENNPKSVFSFQNSKNLDHVSKYFFEDLCIKHTRKYPLHLKTMGLFAK